MAAVVDVSGISYFMPILAFFVIFLVVYVVFKKISFGNNFIQLLLSFIIAAIFVTGFGTISYLTNIATWFSILIISGVFLVAILGLFGKFEGFHKGLGIAFAIIGIIAFLVSGMLVYGSYIAPYLPWGNAINDGSQAGSAVGWLYSGRVVGAILLIVIGAVVAFVLSSGKK